MRGAELRYTTTSRVRPHGVANSTSCLRASVTVTSAAITSPSPLRSWGTMSAPWERGHAAARVGGSPLAAGGAEPLREPLAHLVVEPHPVAAVDEEAGVVV